MNSNFKVLHTISDLSVQPFTP